MCGIVGYIGYKNAYDIIINGLKRLEYRGYDSAGVCLVVDNQFYIKKKAGKVADLEKVANLNQAKSNIGIGHTRWATHGEPNDANSHPHCSTQGLFTLVHNGIIENYAELKTILLNHNFKFSSDTDTEVLVNLIEYCYLIDPNKSFERAVHAALKQVVGAYGIAVLCHNEPEKIIAARKGSPLVIGMGRGEYFIASDASPIVEHTNSVVYLDDDNIAVITNHGITIKQLDDMPVVPIVQTVNLNVAEIEKNGFEHFMLKEIFEQPKAIRDTLRGRITTDKNNIVLGGLLDVMPILKNANRIILVGCGTAWHAATLGEYFIEQYAQIPVEVEYASEFRYRNPIITQNDVVIAVSQSGETADTLAAIKLAKEKGALILGICNVAGSSLTRETRAGIYTHAGIEICVGSTKAFTTQVAVLAMIALKLASEKGLLSDNEMQIILQEFLALPHKMESLLLQKDAIQKIALKYKDATNALFLGRGPMFPIALEGALKLKEISYIHAEGYPAGEMKHGPIALIDENMPTFIVATEGGCYEKTKSAIQEVKARRGKVIAIVNKGNNELNQLANDVIEIPTTHPILEPLLAVIPWQLITYYISNALQREIDQPKNLAKSVTVE